MAQVNMYDQPAQAQFANTYSPIPFSEIVAAGQNKQQHYDVNRTGFERMAQEAEDLYAIPTSEDEAYIRRAQSFMQDLSDKYATQDYGNPEVVNEINRAIRQNVNRRQVQEIQQSYSAWQQNQKNIAQLKSQGKYADYLDEPYRGYSTANTGIYTYQTPAALDYRPKAEDYFKDIKPSSYIRNGEVRDYISAKTIEQSAKGAVQSFLESPEGQQKILELRHRGIEGKPEELAFQYLKEVGKEFQFDRNSGFVPEWMIGGSDRNKQQYPAVTPSFFSSEERFPEQYSNYKKAKSSVKEYRAQREQLESSLNVAKQSKNPEAIQQAEQNLQILDNANAGLESIYQDVYNRASRDFNKSKIEYVNNFKKELSSAGLSKPQVDKLAEVSYEYYSDRGMLTDFFETGESFRDAYTKKYGEEDDVSKLLQPKGVMRSKYLNKIEKAGNSLRTNLSEIESKIDEKAYNIYDAEVSKGINREYFSFPVDNESKKIQSLEGKEVYSNAYRVAEQLKLNANSFEIEPITGGGRLSERQRGKMLEQAYGASSGIDILGASPSDSKYGYLVVKVKDAEGKPVADDNKNTEFRLYLNNPSQMQAIAMDYAMQGNTGLAIRFAQPAIEKQVETAFEYGNRPNSLSVNVLGENVSLTRDNDSKDTYYLQTPSGPVPLEGREEIKNALYTLLQSNLNQ